MALHPTSIGQRAASYQDLLRVLLIVAAVIVLMVAMSVVFGIHQAGPYEIVPDPAGVLGLPF